MEDDNLENVQEVDEVQLETESDIVDFKPPKKNNVGLIILIIVVVVALISCIIILGKGVFGGSSNNNANSSNNRQVNNNEQNSNQNNEIVEPNNNENNENNDNTEIIDEPIVIEGADYLDLYIKKINDSKDYRIQLVRKYDEKHDENTDGYSYAFYDKTNNVMITDFIYGNVTCGGTCKENPNEIGCKETGVQMFSFNVNDVDYIYATFKDNVCGGYQNNSFIYNTETKSMSVEKAEGTDMIDNVDDEIIITTAGLGNDICGGWEYGSAFCGWKNGYIFSKKGEFEVVNGYKTFQKEEYFYVLKGDLVYSKDKNGNEFVSDPEEYELLKYNAKGEQLSKIEHCIAYNEDYAVAYDKKTLVAYDLNGNKIGNFTSVTYDKEKYYYNPVLRRQDDKLELDYKEKNDEINNIELVTFDLKQ